MLVPSSSCVLLFFLFSIFSNCSNELADCTKTLGRT
jgi:hypothetical protein